MRLIPLSSDTETKPTAEMRQAIAAAEVGDEQRGQDPTVNKLQERVAALLGKEAALWFHSGSICNFVATKVLTQPADALVTDWMAHIVRAESGGIAMTSGIQIEPIRTDRGIYSVAEFQEAVARLRTVPVPYGQPPRLAWIEQAHNFGGGSVWRPEEVDAVAKAAHEENMSVHIDGARLMNAAVALGVEPSVFCRHADSVWIDFTKGLGAPIGAVLAGSSSFIAKARRMKHIFGGAMRQAGIAAAGCLHALDNHVQRLAEDHANARRLARGLKEIDGINLHTPEPETNMVFFDATGAGISNGGLLALLAKRGVQMGEVRGRIRAVTHLDVTADDIDRALDEIARAARSARTGLGAFR
jgi:threonine aldolase